MKRRNRVRKNRPRKPQEDRDFIDALRVNLLGHRPLYDIGRWEEQHRLSFFQTHSEQPYAQARSGR